MSTERKDRLEIIECIIKNKIRFIIFLLFYVNNDIELSFSQIQEKLNISKATLSRHLTAMEEVDILETKKGRQYNRKYYRLNQEKVGLIYPQDKKTEDKLDIINGAYTLIKMGLKIFQPIIENFLNSKYSKYEMNAISSQMEEFFLTFQINSDEINEANEVIKEFRMKMEAIEKKSVGKKKDVLITATLLPIEDILELFFKMNKEL